MPTYAVRAPLVRWLRDEARRAHEELGRYRVLDVGCGANWRWAHAGLEKLFAENATWAFVRVTPASGTTACLGMIASIYLDLAFRRLRLGAVARPIIAGINSMAAAIDGSSARLREPGPGALFANVHVVAEAPR